MLYQKCSLLYTGITHLGLMRAAPRSSPKMLSAVSGASPREPSAGQVQYPDTPGWHSGLSWDRQCSLSPHDGSPLWPTVRRMWITTSRWQPHLNTLRLSLSGTSCGSLSNPSCLLLSAPSWWDSNRLLKKKIMPPWCFLNVHWPVFSFSACFWSRHLEYQNTLIARGSGQRCGTIPAGTHSKLCPRDPRPRTEITRPVWSSGKLWKGYISKVTSIWWAIYQQWVLCVACIISSSLNTMTIKCILMYSMLFDSLCEAYNTFSFSGCQICSMQNCGVSLIDWLIIKYHLLSFTW